MWNITPVPSKSKLQSNWFWGKGGVDLARIGDVYLSCICILL